MPKMGTSFFESKSIVYTKVTFFAAYKIFDKIGGKSGRITLGY